MVRLRSGRGGSGQGCLVFRMSWCIALNDILICTDRFVLRCRHQTFIRMNDFDSKFQLLYLRARGLALSTLTLVQKDGVMNHTNELLVLVFSWGKRAYLPAIRGNKDLSFAYALASLCSVD